MNESTLQSKLETAYETELSRLGSSKSMYAATDGDMDTDGVLAAMGERAAAAAKTYDTWAAETADSTLADAYGTIATTQQTHAERIAKAGAERVIDRPTDLQRYLRTLERPPAQAGGLLGWALVTDKTYSQAVGFFVGNLDHSAADLFRELRSELAQEMDRIETLLSESCEESAEWERARKSGATAIEAAYDHYVEKLDDLGVDVKPVC